MDGDQRRKEIIDVLKTAKTPISGTSLGKRFNVSRQVVVQDIALLRTADKGIISTYKGYMLSEKKRKTRVFKVYHKGDRIEEELNIIVDFGACVLNVFVKHAIYGKIEVPLNVESRRDVRLFVDKVAHQDIKPLTEITGGVHYHTVEAESEALLDEVEEALKNTGLLGDSNIKDA